jgi:hypothetical protein
MCCHVSQRRHAAECPHRPPLALTQAHVLSVHQPYQLLMECSSDVVRLQPLEPGVFLVEHADSSIRVVRGAGWAAGCRLQAAVSAAIVL